MATTTHFNEKYADEYGIERANLDDPGFIDKYRRRWGWFDHLMLMNERYTPSGGTNLRRVSPTSPFSACSRCS